LGGVGRFGRASIAHASPHAVVLSGVQRERRQPGIAGGPGIRRRSPSPAWS